MGISTLVVGFVCLIPLAIYKYRRDEEALQAVYDDCAAGEALFGWIDANPDLFIGDYSYSRSLVLRKIATYKHFLETHPFIKEDENYTKFLLSLFDHKGPPPPAKSRPLPRRPSTTWAVSPFRIMLRFELHSVWIRKKDRVERPAVVFPSRIQHFHFVFKQKFVDLIDVFSRGHFKRIMMKPNHSFRVL